MRPRFREWLLSLTQDRPMEEGKKFVEIYAMIYKLLPLELMDEYDDFETPLDEAPIVSQSELTGFDLGVGLGVKAHDAERVTLNDDKLVAWFAGWARMKSEQIRRYHVVYEAVDGGEDVRKQWNRKWTHVSLLPSILFGCFGREGADLTTRSSLSSLPKRPYKNIQFLNGKLTSRLKKSKGRGKTKGGRHLPAPAKKKWLERGMLREDDCM